MQSPEANPRLIPLRSQPLVSVQEHECLGKNRQEARITEDSAVCDYSSFRKSLVPASGILGRAHRH
jgi:hypothetical protein